MKKKILKISGIILAVIICIILGIAINSSSNIDEDMENYKNATDKPQETAAVLPSETPLEESVKPEPEEITATEYPEETKEPVNLAFTGDVLLYERNTPIYDKNGIQGLLQTALIDKLNKADITMINEEFPFSTRGSKEADKQFTFRAAPEYVKAFNEMGVDIVSLANNHTLDFGREAFSDTIETLDNENIKYVGAGKNIEDAKKIEYFEIKGRTIAYIGASRVIPFGSWYAGENTSGVFGTYDPSDALELIKEAKEKADFVVVYVHWGIERKERPEEYQRKMGKQYIDAGADFVIGSHPHVLQGIEFYRGKPIVYSLGNFIFGTTTERTGILNIEIDENDKIEVSLIPCAAKDYKTYMIEDDEKILSFYKYIESISYDVSIDVDGKISPNSID